jgi:hypothetical protein
MTAATIVLVRDMMLLLDVGLLPVTGQVARGAA